MAKKIRFRSMKVNSKVYYSFSFNAHLFLADQVSFMHNGREILHLQRHTLLLKENNVYKLSTSTYVTWGIAGASRCIKHGAS